MYGDTTDSMNRPLITDEVPYSANIGKNATDALKSMAMVILKQIKFL